jgi:hypothetical protein
MARYGLCFLDKLDAAEAKEMAEKEAWSYKTPPLVSNIVNLPSILGLDDFNPNPTF